MNVPQRIIEASAELFIKHGARSITMNDIAAEAGVSKKTLYEHFVNKDDLLGRTLDFLHAEGVAEREEVVGKGGFTIEAMLEITRRTALKFNSINPNFIIDIKKYHPLIWKEKVEKMDKENIEFNAWMIKEGIKKGLFRSDLNVDIISKLLQEQINMLVGEDVFPGDKFSRAEVFQTMMEVFGRGIATDKMLKKLSEFDNTKTKQM